MTLMLTVWWTSHSPNRIINETVLAGRGVGFVVGTRRHLVTNDFIADLPASSIHDRIEWHNLASFS